MLLRLTGMYDTLYVFWTIYDKLSNSVVVAKVALFLTVRKLSESLEIIPEVIDTLTLIYWFLNFKHIYLRTFHVK